MNCHRGHKSRRRVDLLLIMLFALSSPHADAEETQGVIGRLFFTPEYRQNLEQQRQNNVKEIQSAPAEPMLTINGIVTRSSGKRTVWVNGSMQNENGAQSGISITPKRKQPGKVIVRTSDVSSEEVNVGDTINRDTGEATATLGNRAISIRPASAVSTR